MNATLKLLLIFIALTPACALADFQATLVPIPITSAAIEDDPQLATAQSWQLRVASDVDVAAFELYVRVIGGTLYQHSAGSSTEAPNPLFFPIIPSVKFDSYQDMPGAAASNGQSSPDYHDPYEGPNGFSATEGHHFIYKTTSALPPADFTYTQMTVIPDDSDHAEIFWIGRFYQRLTTGVIVNEIAFPESIGAPFSGDMNYDYMVDSDDLDLWRQHFGQAGDLSPPRSRYDLDEDGDVDEIDGQIISGNVFGPGSQYPDAGDFDGDGQVDGDDWKTLYHHNLGHKWNPADLTQDKVVDGQDFLQWQRLVGAGLPPAATPVAAIPEAPSIVLALVASAVLVSQRTDRTARSQARR